MNATLDGPPAGLFISSDIVPDGICEALIRGSELRIIEALELGCHSMVFQYADIIRESAV